MRVARIGAKSTQNLQLRVRTTAIGVTTAEPTMVTVAVFEGDPMGGWLPPSALHIEAVEYAKGQARRDRSATYVVQQRLRDRNGRWGAWKSLVEDWAWASAGIRFGQQWSW